MPPEFNGSAIADRIDETPVDWDLLVPEDEAEGTIKPPEETENLQTPEDQVEANQKDVRKSFFLPDNVMGLGIDLTAKELPDPDEIERRAGVLIGEGGVRVFTTSEIAVTNGYAQQIVARERAQRDLKRQRDEEKRNNNRESGKLQDSEKEANRWGGPNLPEVVDRLDEIRQRKSQSIPT